MIKRVLVLSSQPAFAELVGSALQEGGGYQVTIIDSIVGIRNLESSASFSLLIIDIEQPDEDQLRTLVHFQSLQPGMVSILLLTTSFDTRLEMDGLRLNKVFRKPIYLPDFLEEIKLSLTNAENAAVAEPLQSYRKQLEEALPDQLLEVQMEGNASKIVYFLNGSPLAAVGEYKELIVAELITFLEERAESQLHTNFMKYKQFTGDSEPSLIYFKTMRENEILVMVFPASIPLRDARQQVNLAKQKLLMLNQPKNNIPSFLILEDTQEIRLQTKEVVREEKTTAEDISGINQMPAEQETQAASEARMKQLESAEFLPGWIKEGMEEEHTERTIPTSEKQVSDSAKLNEEVQPSNDISSSSSMNLNNELETGPEVKDEELLEQEATDSARETSRQVNTVDQLISDLEHEAPPADLLAGIVFPWDEQADEVGTKKEWQPESEDLIDEELVQNPAIMQVGTEGDRGDGVPDEGISNATAYSRSDLSQDSLSTANELFAKLDEPEAAQNSITDQNDVVTTVEATHKNSAENKPHENSESTEDFNGLQPSEIRLQPSSPAQVSLYYTCVLIPRFPDQFLVGMISRLLTASIPEICIAFGWRLDRLRIRPMHLEWTIFAPPNISPAKIIRILRRETSKAIFEIKPDLLKRYLLKDFWAPGNLLISGFLAPSQSMVNEYVLGTRSAQGITTLPAIRQTTQGD
ncbi:MAG: hypothetical protein BGO78_08225 [Chloroflexi bacterium 44-23]|nr:MAG: hypothetical protein BGO78_08225 [Chloroflexi bacterium 44-23]